MTSQNASGGSNICLIGMAGSGKSTVGALLARRLEYAFVDLDEEIASQLGLSIGEIFERLGEDRFRQEEQRLLAQRCAGERQVIACGGGIVTTPANGNHLRQQTTIYLQATPKTLAQRVGAGSGRPLLTGMAPIRRRLADLLKEREALYRGASQMAIGTDGRQPAALADELLQMLTLEPQASAP